MSLQTRPHSTPALTVAWQTDPVDATTVEFRLRLLVLSDVPPSDEQIEQARGQAALLSDAQAAQLATLALRHRQPVRPDGKPSEWYRFAGAVWSGRPPCEASPALDHLMAEARVLELPAENLLVGMLCGLENASMSHYRAVLRSLIRLPHNQLASPPVARSAIPWLVNHFERFAFRVQPDIRAAVLSRLHHLDAHDHLQCCLAFAAPSGATQKRDLLAPPVSRAGSDGRWRNLAAALPRVWRPGDHGTQHDTLRFRRDAFFERPQDKAGLPLVVALESALNELLQARHGDLLHDEQLQALRLVVPHLSPSDLQRIEAHFLLRGQIVCLQVLADCLAAMPR